MNRIPPYSELQEMYSRERLGRLSSISQFPHPATPAYLFTKRLFDVLVSGILLVVLLPFFILFSLGIVLDSKGPAIISQRRIGKMGKGFVLYKFRTMHRDVARYAVTPVHGDDSRITRFGKFLRSSSLDELPQLLNVFVGEMSLVGPRPEMPFIVETYGKRERIRLLAKPGITGLWQTHGRGISVHILHTLEYDLYYIAHQSWSLDFLILSRTFPTLFHKKGSF